MMPAFLSSCQLFKPCHRRWLEHRCVGLGLAWLGVILASLIIEGLFISSTSQAEMESQSDYHALFSDLPTRELASIPQSAVADSQEAQSSDLVHVRFDRDADGRAWLVISNDFPWRESFEIQWSGLEPEVIRALEASPPMIVDKPVTGLDKSLKQPRCRWRCEIAAHSHAAWELRASEARIVQWQHRAEPAAIAMLENQLALLNQSLTQLTQYRPLDDTPLHGGFEIDGTDAALPPGWLVSLNPSTTWQISDIEARSGKRSAHYHSRQSGSVGWIQSPAFPLPEGGRVAAEAWIHIAPVYIRPTIIATTTLLKPDGSRQDWRQVYPKSDHIDKNAAWFRINFPTLNSATLFGSVDPACRVQLALDIEGPSQLWIDDVSASRIFLDEDERRQLRSQLFVARRELSQGRPSTALQFTRSESFRYVFENAPIVSLANQPSAAVLEVFTQPESVRSVRQAERPPLRRRLR